MSAPPQTLAWIGGIDGCLRLLDQTCLPQEIVYRDCRTVEEVWESIKTLRVRGAPAIGVAAAFGVVVGLQQSAETRLNLAQRLDQVTSFLASSRPTAVNLFWALERMKQRAQQAEPISAVAEIRRLLLDEAQAIAAEDRAMCRAIGRLGADLVPNGGGVLTHCNAGALATADYGTALAVLYSAAERGKRFTVYVDETRPLLQGARLTAWELQQRAIDVVLICDNMAAQVMKEQRVQLVVVGADRIAANGDAANKIGTYGVALLARAHGIPFYVAAPSSTFDMSLDNGEQIPIEQRDGREITHGFGRATAPEGVRVYNPAFDVTPAHLITGIITERGIVHPVQRERIHQVLFARPS